MKWSVLVNPFTKFSEKQLLAVGVISLLSGSFFAGLVGVTFDGVIDVHLWPEMTFFLSLKENAVTVVLLTLLLFALGKIINSKTRLVDILNAGLLFRIPFYFSGALVTIPFIKEVEDSLIKNAENMANFQFKTTDLIVVLLLTGAIIALLVYSIAILYNGFKTATNLKMTSHKVYFSLVILLAEILSKLILPFI